MNNFYFWLGAIVFIKICLYGLHNKEKRLLITILLFLFGSLPWIIYGLIEIGMRSSSDWSIIICVALSWGVMLPLIVPFSRWSSEKGYDVWQRFFRYLFQRKK